MHQPLSICILGILPALLLAAEPSPAGHWAFQPVRPEEAPQVNDAGWPRDTLDNFILAQLESAGLAPAPEASRQVLLRRLSFALTGLAPSTAHLQTYLVDQPDAPLDAYVDALMDSPAFGTHWSRHWLDHVRYRPFPGRNHGNDPYRLWVERAFNQDMPYAKFIQMQIAGDLMPGNQPGDEIHLDGLVAVRPFSLKNRHTHQLDLLGRTFLGLSLACAECHDHKHEPLLRNDYYALKGVYESSRVMKLPYLRERKQFDQYKSALAQKEANQKRMKEELKEFARVSQLLDLRKRIESERAKLDNPKEARNHDKIRKNLEKLEKDQHKRLEEIQKRGLALDAPQALEYIRLKEDNLAFDQKWKEVFLFDAFVDQEDAAMIADSRPPQHGLVVKPGDDPPRDPAVPRRFPAVLAGDQQTPLGERTRESGRLELARWLTSPDHPITARLLVNRLWYYLLGEGLTPSLSNFGHSGRPPTHPRLLDHLAHDFIENGGSMKTLIRRIVLSSTFRQASSIQAGRDERDLRLQLFGMARVRRLQAESIWRTLNQLEYGALPEDKRRNPPHDLVQETNDLFDGADSSLIVPRRTASVSSLQALFLLNSEHLQRSTERIATRLHALPDDPARIHEIHRLLYSRDATPQDLADAREFLAAWDSPPPPGQRPSKTGPPPEILTRWQAYLQALLATNEFLFVD